MSFILNARKKVYDLLEGDHSDNRLGRLLDIFLIGLILCNVAAVVVESERSIYLTYKNWFDDFEYFSVVIFSIEFFARLWCAPEGTPYLKNLNARLRWLKTPSAIIDFLAIVPAFLTAIMPIDLRFLRLLRLVRLLKLTRYFAALRILLKVLMRERGSFQAVLLILVMMIVVAASGIYVVEHKVQPESFGSIPQSMWWAVVTLTTVGYGDVTPVTTAGKIFGAIITILGIGVAALPAGILASGLADELAQRREMLEQKFREILLSDEVDISHTVKITSIRKELGISKEQAKEIIAQVVREQKLAQREKQLNEKKQRFCPNCGHDLEGH